MFQIKLPKTILLHPEQPKWAIASFVLGFLSVCYAARRVLAQKHEKTFGSSDNSVTSTDPGILKKGTSFESYTSPSGHEYPGIRTFYHAHPKVEKLPDNLPLLVFVHGLGGSAAQFAPLMTSLVNIAPCLAIDLPGCGLSAFEPGDVVAYTTVAFAELLYCAIERFRNEEVDQKVIVIGHSMGCSIASLLASSTSPLAHLSSRYIAGIVAICPRSSALSTAHLASLKRLSWIPSRLFDLMRLADRRGGVESASVYRVVGKEADLETRKLQLRFNEQSKSPVFQRFCEAMHLQETDALSAGHDSLLGHRVWAGIKVPLFLVAAENDKLAPPREVEQITAWLTQPYTSANDSKVKESEGVSIVKTEEAVSVGSGSEDGEKHSAVTSVETVVPTQVDSIAGEAAMSSLDLPPVADRNVTAHTVKGKQGVAGRSLILKTSIFPAPASHGLMYASADARILSGLIENFLAKYVDVRISPGWQLQHLTTSGKWDVKNLKKWQSVDPCSAPIGGVFRALKTMREVDDDHCPREFVKKYGYRTVPDGVAMVVDISHETPVYDKAGLEEGGLDYHKFPTVSKLPPMADEVARFVALIDDLRQAPNITQHKSADGKSPTIGVHCHYGFNRTGFFLVCYLVERLGYKLQDAIEEFATKRPPGIKHEYFVNELFVRYAVKMERRGTVIA